MSVPFILASSSPARRRLLLSAGVQPLIRVPHLDERRAVEDYAASRGVQRRAVPAYQRVMVLSNLKAQAVYRQYVAGEETLERARGVQVTQSPLLPEGDPHRTRRVPLAQAVRADRGLASLPAGPLLLGCDSMFELSGVAYGKPGTRKEAIRRLRLLSGRSGTLWTGQTLIDCRSGERRHAVSSTRVSFAPLTEREIRAYAHSGEPLGVAGSFALEGLGGAFITSVTGSPSGVIGLSLPLLREMAGALGVTWTDLWNTPYALGLSPQRVRAPQGTNPSYVFQPGDGWYSCACGHRHWGVHGGAGVLLARRDPKTGRVSKVVLQHRALNSVQGGTWGAPGGAMADGESPYEGALRESLEEASLNPADLSIVGADVESHGEWKYTTLLAFEKPGHTVVPKAGDNESLEVRWVPVDKVPTLPLLTAFREEWPGHLAALRAAAETS